MAITHHLEARLVLSVEASMAGLNGFSPNEIEIYRSLSREEPEMGAMKVQAIVATMKRSLKQMEQPFTMEGPIAVVEGTIESGLIATDLHVVSGELPEGISIQGNSLDMISPVAGENEEKKMILLPVELYSDLNNDGEVNSTDSGLVGKPYASGASEEEKDKGTEFMFANDNLSNGAWDKEDTTTPGKPADADDDDAEPIFVGIGSLPDETQVWPEHPASAGLKYYRDRKCTEEIPLSSGQPHVVGGSVEWPDDNIVFVRAENVSFPDAANPQVEGDLKLMIKPGGSANGIEATKTFTHHKDYGASTRYRIVAMHEEATVMFGLDTYDHAAGQPRLKGIDVVKANYSSDVIINGNQCFFSGLPTWGGMTNRCDGRLFVGRQILRPPSDDTHHPDLGGALGRYIGHTLDPQSFTFGAGQIPDPPNVDQGMGGLSTNFGLAVRQSAENQVVGRGKVHETGKGIIFTATNYDGKGGAASPFAADAANSGVQPLSGGNAGNLELLFLDGSSSVGLVLTNPNGDQQTVIKGSKHNGNFYYINTYLLFECDKPRN